MFRGFAAPILVLAIFLARFAVAGPTTRPDSPMYLPKIDPKLQDWYDHLQKKLGEQSAAARAASPDLHLPFLVVPPGVHITPVPPGESPLDLRNVEPGWGLNAHGEITPYGPSFMFNGLRVYVEPVASRAVSAQGPIPGIR